MKKKLLMTLAIAFCAVALVVGSVVGTIAYLRSTAYVTNVFTYGTVKVTLDETKIADDGINVATPASRTSIGNKYKLLPGVTYIKDPVIRVDKDSEETYLFLRVENPLSAIEAPSGSIDTDDNGTLDNKTIYEQLVANGWELLDEKDSEGNFIYGNGTNIYRYTVNGGAVNPEGEQKDIVTFSTFTVSDSLRGAEDFAAYTSKSVVVVVYAVQEESLSDWEAAANVFVNDFKNPILTAGN